MPGHLFVTRGDLGRLACDAVLVPSGRAGRRFWHVSNPGWHRLLEGLRDEEGFVAPHGGWSGEAPTPSEGRRVVRLARSRGPALPEVWAGHTGEGGQEPQWYAEAIGEFLGAATASLGRARGAAGAATDAAVDARDRARGAAGVAPGDAAATGPRATQVDTSGADATIDLAAGASAQATSSTPLVPLVDDPAPRPWRPLDDPRPLLAVPLVGVGRGGADRRKGEAVTAIVETIDEVQQRLDVDVVLVMWTPESFAAGQQARRKVVGPRAWDALGGPEGPMRREALALAEQARAGQLVPFVGAGAGIGAGLPSWKDLLRLLGRDAGLDDTELAQLHTLDARDAGAVIARRLQARLGDGASTGTTVPENVLVPTSAQLLADQVRRRATSDRVSLLHQLLASLPVTEAVTTNYDTCLERAFADAGRPLKALPGAGADEAGGWLLKLHGSVDRDEGIVLSRDDYLRFEGEGVALAGVVQAMLLTRHLVFVGYSLSDDTFHRLVHQTRRALELAGERGRSSSRMATALTPDAPTMLQEIWDEQVHFVSAADGSRRSPRRLAILLDLVAAEASPAAAHLLDETYDSMFDSAERELGEALDGVWRVLGDPDVELPQTLRDAVGEALGRLGAPARGSDAG